MPPILFARVLGVGCSGARVLGVGCAADVGRTGVGFKLNFNRNRC